MKIIVVGAGLIGVSTAFFLNQQGHEVIVLDRKDGPGMDTSFANGGMLTPSQAEPWNHPGILWKVISWLGDEDSPFLLRPRVLFSILGWSINFIRNSRPGKPIPTNRVANMVGARTFLPWCPVSVSS